MTEIEAAKRLGLICGDQKRISELGYEAVYYVYFTYVVRLIITLCTQTNVNMPAYFRTCDVSQLVPSVHTGKH